MCREISALCVTRYRSSSRGDRRLNRHSPERDLAVLRLIPLTQLRYSICRNTASSFVKIVHRYVKLVNKSLFVGLSPLKLV